MNKFNDVDLTRGYQKYDAMVKNIEGIFNKINQLFDISEYKKETLCSLHKVSFSCKVFLGDNNISVSAL